MKKVAIINYGMGNLRSVENAIKRLNFDPKIVSKPKELNNYEKIILPGVGSFKKAMKLLNKNNWINYINLNIKEKKKYLFGICLGMQLLASESEEFGDTKGLELIKGKIKFLGNIGCKLKIPHIGWNSVFLKKKHQFLEGVSNNMDFYFVNSYAFVPEEKSFEIAKTKYGVDFCSIISTDNIFGVQFHPEKSSKVGSKILENFLNA